jgi:hypothetical protein
LAQSDSRRCKARSPSSIGHRRNHTRAVEASACGNAGGKCTSPRVILVDGGLKKRRTNRRTSREHGIFTIDRTRSTAWDRSGGRMVQLVKQDLDWELKSRSDARRSRRGRSLTKLTPEDTRLSRRQSLIPDLSSRRRLPPSPSRQAARARRRRWRESRRVKLAGRNLSRRWFSRFRHRSLTS